MFITIINILNLIIFTCLQGGGHAVVPGVDQHPRRVHPLSAQGGQGGAWNSIQGLNKKKPILISDSALNQAGTAVLRNPMPYRVVVQARA